MTMNKEEFKEMLQRDSGPHEGEDEADWLLRLGIMEPDGHGTFRVAARFVGALSQLAQEDPRFNIMFQRVLH